MAYSQKTIDDVMRAPKTLGNQLGRWAVHHDFSVVRIADLTGATRQSVYNWFFGGEVLNAYRPSVESILNILRASRSPEEAWSKACKAFDRRT